MTCLPPALTDKLRCRHCGRLATNLGQCPCPAAKPRRRRQADVSPGLWSANGYAPAPTFRSATGVEVWQGDCYPCNLEFTWRLVRDPQPAVQLVNERPLRRPPKKAPAPYFPGFDPAEVDRVPRKPK
jgi:hypothetical protein